MDGQKEVGKCSAQVGERCCVSTGIHEGLTFGSGKIDRHGYWEIPCEYHARHAEKRDLQPVGTFWPFPGGEILLGETKDEFAWVDDLSRQFVEDNFNSPGLSDYLVIKLAMTTALLAYFERARNES